MKNKQHFRLLWIALAAAVLPMLALAGKGEETVTRQLGNDLFSAGSTVTVQGEIAGDVLLAGGEVRLDGVVGGDAVAAGGNVRLGGTIRQDLYAAGGNVRIIADVAGSGRIAGGQIEIAREASIDDGLSVGGGQIDVDGRVGRYAQISGGKIRIDGRVSGDVMVAGGELTVGPNAVIDGRLTFRGPQAAKVDPAAKIAGGVHHIKREFGKHEARAALGIITVIGWIGWAIVGILLLALAPLATRDVADTIRLRPWAALPLGFAILFAAPIAIVLVAITVIGIPLALLLLCVYLLLVPLGGLAAVIAAGDIALSRMLRERPITTPPRIGAFIVALVVAFLLACIPFFGGIVCLLLASFGIGGVALAVASRRRSAA